MKRNSENYHIDDDDMFLESKKPCYKSFITTIIITLIILSASYFIYKKSQNADSSEIIIISAEDNENDNKEQPLDPGGMVVSNMDKDIYDTIDKTSKKTKEEIETLLPPSEEPVNKNDIIASKEQKISNETPPAATETNLNASSTDAKIVTKEEDYIKPVAETKSKKKNKFAKKAENSYRVQIASFKSKKDAQKQWELLSKRYKKLLEPYQHYIVSKDIEGKGIFQRLQIGPFKNEGAARKACSEFKNSGLNCFIIKPND